MRRTEFSDELAVRISATPSRSHRPRLDIAGNDFFDLGFSFYTRTTGGFGGSSSVTVTVYDQIVFGYEGDDEIRGNGGVDRLVGGPGNDLLKGGSGSDMYVYASGDGLDRIVDDSGSSDTIYFSSELNSADLRVARVAGTNDLLLHFGDTAAGIVPRRRPSCSSVTERPHVPFRSLALSGASPGVLRPSAAIAGASELIPAGG